MTARVEAERNGLTLCVPRRDKAVSGDNEPACRGRTDRYGGGDDGRATAARLRGNTEKAHRSPPCRGDGGGAEEKRPNCCRENLTDENGYRMYASLCVGRVNVPTCRTRGGF